MSKMVRFFDLWLFDWQVRCSRERLNCYGAKKMLDKFLLDSRLDFSVSKYFISKENK